MPTPLILFDIDLTLIHTSGAGRRALNAAFTRLWDLEEPMAGVAIDGRTDHAIFREVILKNSLANGDLDGVLASLIDAYVIELPLSVAASENRRVLPGVHEVLHGLEAEGVRPGLATGNIRAGAAVKLDHFSLWEHFAAGGFGDDYPLRADVVRCGIRELAACLDCDPDPARAIVVGDTPLDVEAAHLAGARCLAVATGSYSADQLAAAGADHVLPDLADADRVLEILLGG